MDMRPKLEDLEDESTKINELRALLGKEETFHISVILLGLYVSI